jgi:hypothetical protein
MGSADPTDWAIRHLLQVRLHYLTIKGWFSTILCSYGSGASGIECIYVRASLYRNIVKLKKRAITEPAHFSRLHDSWLPSECAYKLRFSDQMPKSVIAKLALDWRNRR